MTVDIQQQVNPKQLNKLERARQSSQLPVHGDINLEVAATIHEVNALLVVLNSVRLLWEK